MEGSEEYFDESEHVDGLAKEEVEKTRERGRGREREGPKTHVGWPEEPQLRGVLMVRFRRSANTHRIDGVSQCVGCGVILRRRAREEDASVRRGVISRRRRVLRKVARMRKRVTRRCGMRCRKPYQRWGMKITTRPFFVQGLKRRDPLHHHHPGRQCGRRVCLVYLYLLVSMCTTPSMS